MSVASIESGGIVTLPLTMPTEEEDISIAEVGVDVTNGVEDTGVQVDKVIEEVSQNLNLSMSRSCHNVLNIYSSARPYRTLNWTIIIALTLNFCVG